MIKRVRQELEQQSGKFRKLHHVTVMQPVKPWKDNTSAISHYNDIQTVGLQLWYLLTSLTPQLSSSSKPAIKL